MSTSSNPAPTELSVVKKVTFVGFWVNVVLMILKLVIGYYGRSDALVADGFHSMSDLVSDIVVLAFAGIAYKAADDDHPYGHGKYETLSGLIISVSLLAVSVWIVVSGISAIRHSLFDGMILPRPDIWTLVVAAASIGAKEVLFRYTIYHGRRIDSSAVIVNAWHHRSDAISSIATLVGVSASYFLGESWRILDPIVSVVIAFFIGWTAFRLATPALNELLEKALPKEVTDRAAAVIASTPGVENFHRLRTRRNGHSYIFDVHIRVRADLSVARGHEIATAVEHRLAKEFGPHTIVTVHVEPWRTGNQGSI